MGTKDYKRMYLDRYENIYSEEKVYTNNSPKEKRSINYYLNKQYGEQQMLEAIHSIIDYFDFEKIHNVMEYLDWQWRDNGVPSVQELKDELLNRLFEIIEEGSRRDEDEMESSCGGFHVRYRVFEPEGDEPDDFEHNVSISVAFELEEYNTLY